MNTTTLNMTTLDGGVIIKKGTAPAPPSGGESGGGEWIYLDYKKIPKDEWWGSFALGMCYTAKLNTGGSIQIRPLNYFWLLGSNIDEIAETVVAIAIDRGSLIGSVEEGLYPLGTMFSSVPNLDDYCITKEQFYTLD